VLHVEFHRLVGERHVGALSSKLHTIRDHDICVLRVDIGLGGARKRDIALD
jgi:hypothetical protein